MLKGVSLFLHTYMRTELCDNNERYTFWGVPFVERPVTVDGACVKNPRCVIAPIGVSLAELIEFCGGLEGEPFQVHLFYVI